MRIKKAVLLSALLWLLPAGVSAAEENPFERKLPFEKATISYTISGMEEGSEVVYIRDHGRQSATYHKTVGNMMGVQMQNDTIEFEDPDWVYSFDLIENTGVKSTNPLKYMKEEYAKLSSAEKKQVWENSKQLGIGVMAGMGGTVEENAVKMLGYDCDKVTMMGTTVYSIHDSQIPLKTESNMMGMKMSIVATSVDEGKVDDKYFTHPAGIEVTTDPEADQMAQQMAKQTISWMKDPDASKKMPQMSPMNQSVNLENLPEVDPEMMKQLEQMMEGMKGAVENQ